MNQTLVKGEKSFKKYIVKLSSLVSSIQNHYQKCCGDIIVMFLVWQFVSDLLVPSVTWWVTWNSDDYRDAGTNEAKYTNGARPDAARDNGAILTLILWSCSRVPCFSLTNDANIWPSENIFIELINGSDIMAVICWKLMVSTGRVYQPDIAICQMICSF